MIDVSQPQNRGYVVLYRTGEPTRCPACAGSNWFVGRVHAECGFCAAAIPLFRAPTGYMRHAAAA